MINVNEEIYGVRDRERNSDKLDSIMANMRNILGKILYVDYNLNSPDAEKTDALKTLLDYSDKLITAKEISIAMQNTFVGDLHYSQDDLLKYGTRLNEGSLFLPKAGKYRRILVRNDLTLNHDLGTAPLIEHKNYPGKLFVPNDFNVKKYLSENDHIVVDKPLQDFNPKNFVNPITKWLFGDQVEKYATFLRGEDEKGRKINNRAIQRVPFKMYDTKNSDSDIDLHPRPFATPIWMSGSTNLFSINGYMPNTQPQFQTYRLRAIKRFDNKTDDTTPKYIGESIDERGTDNILKFVPDYSSLSNNKVSLDLILKDNHVPDKTAIKNSPIYGLIKTSLASEGLIISGAFEDKLLDNISDRLKNYISIKRVGN